MWSSVGCADAAGTREEHEVVTLTDDLFLYTGGVDVGVRHEVAGGPPVDGVKVKTQKPGKEESMNFEVNIEVFALQILAFRRVVTTRANLRGGKVQRDDDSYYFRAVIMQRQKTYVLPQALLWCS